MTEAPHQQWERICGHLRAHHPLVCRKWFADLEPLGPGSGAFWIRAHSDLHRDYLRRDCLDAFNDAVRTVSGQLMPVRFLGPDDAWTPPPSAGRSRRQPPAVHHPPSADTPPARPTHAASERTRADRPDSLPINPDFDFDHFVTGPNNRLAHAAAVAVSQHPGKAYNPVFIHGAVGLGKTHLLQAICLEIQHRDPGAVIHYVSCDAFVTHFMGAVQSGGMAGFRHEFRDVDVLVIDDIHFLAGRERTQEEFFHTFNSLFQADKQIVLSSDAAPGEIPDLEERLVSRFKWGLVALIEPPSYETRVAILKTKASLRGIDLTDDVASYIAQEIDTNIRELEGAIVKLQIQSSVEQRPIDLGLAQEGIGGIRAESPAPSIDTIIAAVSEYYHVKRVDVLGKRRHKSVSLPRQLCMFLARAHTRHSLEEIGAHFGGRDHTTVIHAVRSIEKRRDADQDFASVVRSLEGRVRRAPGRATHT